jgi:predicted amidophosphoribosyltransferase
MKKNHSSKTVIKERYKLCPGCKNFMPFEIQDKYCYLCGEEMLEVCPACKEPIIYPTSTYCPVCGALLVRLNSIKEK